MRLAGVWVMSIGGLDLGRVQVVLTGQFLWWVVWVAAVSWSCFGLVSLMLRQCHAVSKSC